MKKRFKAFIVAGLTLAMGATAVFGAAATPKNFILFEGQSMKASVVVTAEKKTTDEPGEKATVATKTVFPATSLLLEDEGYTYDTRFIEEGQKSFKLHSLVKPTVKSSSSKVAKVGKIIRVTIDAMDEEDDNYGTYHFFKNLYGIDYVYEIPITVNAVSANAGKKAVITATYSKGKKVTDTYTINISNDRELTNLITTVSTCNTGAMKLRLYKDALEKLGIDEGNAPAIIRNLDKLFEMNGAAYYEEGDPLGHSYTYDVEIISKTEANVIVRCERGDVEMVIPFDIYAEAYKGNQMGASAKNADDIPDELNQREITKAVVVSANATAKAVVEKKVVKDDEEYSGLYAFLNADDTVSGCSIAVDVEYSYNKFNEVVDEKVVKVDVVITDNVEFDIAKDTYKVYDMPVEIYDGDMMALVNAYKNMVPAENFNIEYDLAS